jgi:hypothetical protein
VEGIVRRIERRIVVRGLTLLVGGWVCSAMGLEATAQQLPRGVPPPAPGSGTGPAGLTWTAPKGWVVEPPSSSMRRAQYRIPGPAGAGECVVFYFGAGQGGDAETNAARWAEQFEQPDGSPSRKALKTKTLDVNGIRVTLAEITGTYRGGMPGGPAAPTRPDYMLLGAIARGPDANWFFKATGPRPTMEANRAAFDAMVQSLKPGQ